MSIEHTWDDTVAAPFTERYFEIDEPIEIRIKRRNLAKLPYVLACWNRDGMIGYSLSIGGQGQPEALSNLGSNAVFPHKAVAEWQHEVVAFVTDNRYGYTIEEVR